MAIGLGLILLLFGFVVAWTVQESIEAAYRERAALAQVVAGRVDDEIRYALVTLEREAADLAIQPGHPLTGDQRRHLVDLRPQVGTLSVVSVVDIEGNNVWIDAGRHEDIVGNPYYHSSVRLVLQTGEPQVAELSSASNAGKVVACLAVPLHDEAGNLAGALMAELDPSHSTLGLLPTEDVGNGVQVQMVSAGGQLLAGSEGPNPESLSEHEALLSDLIAARTPGYRIHQPSSGGGGSSHLVTYAPVPLLPSWGIIIEQPRDVVLATPRWLEQRLAVLGFVALLIAAAVAWFDIRSVVYPLQHLTATAERFAAGQLDEPVHLDRADEMGILASAFETMRQRLRASLAEVAEWNRELERRVAARTAEVEARNRELAHLNEVAELVSRSLDIRPTLDRTLERIIEITGADAGWFRTVEGDGTQMALAASCDVWAALQTDENCAQHCACGQAISLNKVVFAGREALGPEAAPCRAMDLQSMVAVPLSAGERVQGVLFLGSRRPGHFQQEQFNTFSAIGRQVGMALANASLYQSLQVRERERAELLQQLMAGQEEERRRVARELHDDTSQALASLQLGLERLVTGNERPEQSRQLARQLQGVAAQALAEVHRLAVELRPSVLDDIGLVAAIQRHLQECAQHSGIVVDFACVGVEHLRLIPAAETSIYRVVQAALTNVVQHAEAQRVSVLLQRREEKLVVVIEDDGQGFDLSAAHGAPLERRLGLAGMEERAHLIGAAFTIETTPGAGTTVFLEVPLDQNCRQEEGEVEIADRIG
ncbi:MAG: GAF domain-containing protein [Chloroflexi bacterium]|nr:GAF domain-containing protein [Chloroflexota bacterium]